MKRFLSVFLCVCLVMTTLASGVVTVFAEGNKIESTEITWNFNAETGELHFEGEGPIPDFNNYSEAGAIPWANTAFTSIVFSEGITAIGNYAFYSCESLKEVVIPDTVTVLGNGIFNRCTALESVKLPSEVTAIGDNMFSLCLALKDVTFGAKIQSIGTKAFYRCAALESITLPETFKSIGTSAFEMCTELKEVILPEGLVSIGDRAFFNCENLLSITLPSTLETLGASAFNECNKLAEITIPEKITTIPAEAFYNCTSLASVTLPTGLVAIEDKAFYLCPSLLNVAVPVGVNTFGEMALGYGSKSEPIKGFKITSFYNTNARLYAEKNGFEFESIGYVITGECGETATWEYNADEKTLYIKGSGAIKDYTKDNIAIYNLIDFEKVVISEEITKIGAYAFYGAPAVEFELSTAITEIGEKAIGYYADKDNKDTVREETLITAYERTAAHSYAKENNIAFNSLGKLLANEGSCGENATWTYNEETKTLTINGTGAIADYTPETVPDYVYHDVTSIVIGKGITKIGAYAFYGAPALKFTLSRNITEIGEKAIGYYADENGAEARREGTVISAYEQTAAHTYATANEITFDSKGVYIATEGKCGENATWSYNKDTKVLTISGTGAIDNFKADALPEFADYEISSVVVTDGITAIGDYALATTKDYAEITIGKDVMSIGQNAFGVKKTFIPDENGNPTDEVAFIPNNELVVKGYLVTPADEYSREYEFIFEALDGDTYIEFSSNISSVTDHINKFLFVYPARDNTAEINITAKDESITVTKPEKFKTKALLTFTKGDKTEEYTVVVVGDANCDGVVNSTDALRVLMHTVEKNVIDDAAVTQAGDIDNNGAINSTDALAILQISVDKKKVTDFYNPGKI
ncbi:MAG: leucine-rich repeat protein [Clostridia bacterium]|nr:leucine-rich repeat protein [Clostridia bacterium]